MDERQQPDSLQEIAEAQVCSGLRQQAVKTAETILTERNRQLPKIAAIFAEVDDRKHFKQLLIPCAYYLDAVYEICGLLARLYPEQAAEVAKVVSELN